MSGYMKRAVIYDEPNKGGHINCECGKRLELPRELPDKLSGGYVCDCGICYDSNGWITYRPSTVLP